MSRVWIRRSGMLSVMVLLGACAGPATRDTTGLPAPPQGDVVVREYVDPQKRDGVEQYFRIRYLWDYQANVAVMERASLDGVVLERKPMPGLTLETTPEELDYAIAMVRHDPQLHALVDRPGVNFQGGFSVRTPELDGCNLHSRCIHIFASSGADDEISVARAIVDLAGRRIVDRGIGGE